MNRSVVALVSFALVISFALATSGCGPVLRKAVSAMGRSGGKPAAKGAAAAAGKASAKAAGAASARAASKASAGAATKTASKAGSRSSGKSSSNVWWKVTETVGNEAIQRSIDLTPSTESRSTYVPPSVVIPDYPLSRYETPPTVYIPPPTYQPPVYQPPPQQYNYQYYPR